MVDTPSALPENLPTGNAIQFPKPVDLGAFTPPHDFDHGEEFEPNVPRPIPGYLKAGSHARRQRGVLYTLFVLGLMFIVFWPIPFVQGLSYYILPLQWLHWIGLGLIAIAAFKLIANFVTSGRYQYVREGTPFVGRVTSIDHVGGGTAEAPQFKFMATVEFKDPETGEHIQNFMIPAEDFWGAGEVEKHQCTVSPGDYVTLVGLPGKVEKTTKLYGFLGLDPEREFLLKNNQPLRGTSPFTAVMIAFLISAVVVLIMFAFDVLMFSFPIDGDWKLPVGLAVGGFFLAGVAGVILRTIGQSNEKDGELGPVGAFLLAGFFGGVGAPLAMIILNSRLDVGESTLKPITIENFWQTTHNFIIRDYEVEYRDLLGGGTQKRHVRISQLARLESSEFGAVEIRPGRFGYPWISGVHPVAWISEEEAPHIKGPKYDLTYAIASDDPEADTTASVRLIPVIELDNLQFAPLPEALLDKAVGEVAKYASKVEKVE